MTGCLGLPATIASTGPGGHWPDNRPCNATSRRSRLSVRGRKKGSRAVAKRRKAAPQSALAEDTLRTAPNRGRSSGISALCGASASLLPAALDAAVQVTRGISNIVQPVRRCIAGAMSWYNCQGGLGRSGMIGARLLIELGMEPATAIGCKRAARLGAIETRKQEKYVLRIGANQS